MVHSRSGYALLRREARRVVLRDAYWDRERGESVATRDVKVVGVLRGEVLYDVRGYVSPSVDPELCT